jgi:hypothetical protein
MAAIKNEHKKRIGWDATDFRPSILDSSDETEVVRPKREKSEFNLGFAGGPRV